MRRGLFLATLIGLSLAIVSGPAFAAHDHDAWFKKYDRDHDGQWNYDEFCAWQRAHHKHLTDRQLRELYDRYDTNHDNYWQWEEARKYHH
jgi:hypothetical protein